MKKKCHIVHIIEDDNDLAKAIQTLLIEEQFKCHHYKTAEDFLGKLSSENETIQCQLNSSIPNCLLIDVRLPKISGLSLFQELIEKPGRKLSPIIFLTGHGDLQMAVDSLKKGAFDFLTKPYKVEDLLSTIKSAMRESEFRIEQQIFVSNLENKIENLTTREKELVEPIASGLSNKDIAEKFQNSIRTIELHRSRVFEKLNLVSAVELATIIERFNALKADLND